MEGEGVLLLDCERLGVRSGGLQATLCVRRTGALLRLCFDDATERVLLARIGGPHPQTRLLKRSRLRPTDWLTWFHICKPGNYSVRVQLLMIDPWRCGEHGRWDCRL